MADWHARRSALRAGRGRSRSHRERVGPLGGRFVDSWKTAISDADATHIWFRGHDITTLMATASFSDVVFLLHEGRLPTPDERRLIDAILIAVADHGPGSPSAAAARVVASGNRVAPEAAVAAGVLAIGDKHAGAGEAC